MIPKELTQEEIEQLIKNGMIPKNELIDQNIYLGSCRNSEIAIWDKEKQCFIYNRNKFGEIFEEEIKHPEDDNGFDIFIPIRNLNNKIYFKFK